MIKLFVIGNLGKDAVTNTVNGKSVINFAVAHTERFKDAQGNTKDKTTWVDCSYWTDKTAVAPYLKKGTQVYVEGTPDVRTYTTQNGVNAATMTLRVGSVQLLGSKSTDGGVAQTGGMAQHSNNEPSDAMSNFDSSGSMDDLPF